MNRPTLPPLPLEDRPHSSMELNEMRNDLFHKLHLASKWISHARCGHSYHVRANSQKHTELMRRIQENQLTLMGEQIPGIRDIGGCSVCWKLRQDPAAQELVDQYQAWFDEPRHTWMAYVIESEFYKWLYALAANRADGDSGGARPYVKKTREKN